MIEMTNIFLLLTAFTLRNPQSHSQTVKFLMFILKSLWLRKWSISVIIVSLVISSILIRAVCKNITNFWLSCSVNTNYSLLSELANYKLQNCTDWSKDCVLITKPIKTSGFVSQKNLRFHFWLVNEQPMDDMIIKVLNGFYSKHIPKTAQFKLFLTRKT